MDLVDQLRLLSSRIAATKDMIQTEEATKNSMVMPFIQALGYNVFDPTEVTPELVADIGTKKGEKVDYAILKDGKPIILFECKKSGAELNINHSGQLFRYFHVTEARFGVLTNGLQYKFFTDLEQPNKMDEKPFFEFSILDFKDRDVEELKKFAKIAFDVENILTTANDLKFTRAIKATLSGLLAKPSEDFVRLVAADLTGGRRFTPAVIEQFTGITKQAFEQFIGERINERLKGAMTPESVTVSVPQPAEEVPAAPTTEVMTTAHELEAFHSIRAILRDVVPMKRVFLRDAKTYCTVILDDNNRKMVCRLWFNNPEKLRLGLFGPGKTEEQVSLSAVEDIFNHSERLKATVQSILGEVSQQESPEP